MQFAGIKDGRVYLPYAFTEQGVYMLMTVLKEELKNLARSQIVTARIWTIAQIENSELYHTLIEEMIDE